MRSGLELVCPVSKAGGIAFLGLGPRARTDGPRGEEVAFLRSVAACAATPIENGLIYDELQRVNQRLSVKVFQLHNLFDISRELTASLEERPDPEPVHDHRDGALRRLPLRDLRAGPEGLEVVHERGWRERRPAPVPTTEALPR